MNPARTDQPWWFGDIATVLRHLGCGADGLSSTEASTRLAHYGPNHPRERRLQPLLVQFALRFRNPLVIVLLAASAISAAVGEVKGFVIITTVLLVSVMLDFVQEHRASRAAERLRDSVVTRATVLRDGAWRELPIADVAPGDVVRLSAGDVVPADGRVLRGRDFFVNEALLTGEAFPVEKHPGGADASGAVFMGTAVISGGAEALICATGSTTQFATIAESLQDRPPPGAFETGARRFGLLIMRLTLFMVLFVLLVNMAFHRPLLESFLFAVALAVGLTPELLPMVVTVTLARGALRMADRQVVVKQLAAIHNLGSMNILCTDKTGTLTEARIRLERHVDPSGRASERVLELAYLNSRFETGLKSPLDEAILEHREIDVGGWRKVDEVPFDFERRRVSVLLERDGRRLLVAKGAPEDLLRLSTRYEAGGPDTLLALDDEARQRIGVLHDALAAEGFRMLAIAWRGVPPQHAHAVIDDETELTFAGFAAFLDPPKQTARTALQALAASGIAIKIVTGDNELVTQHVCRELALPIAGVLTGHEISRLDDQALAVRAESVNLFCRVTPAQKNRVILALKSRGHVVGYLGDGINDAPSLRSADVGLSVDAAADVAREAAEVILLQHDLGVLHDGVIEGRRTFGNIMKYIMMGTSSNFGNMFSMAGAALFLPFLPMTPAQILLNNMLYDVSEIAIPFDRVDRQELGRPRAWDMDFIRNFMLVMGPVSSLFDFLTFYVLLAVFQANEALFQTGWFIESLATQILVIFVIRTRGNPLASRPHPLLAASSLGIVALAVVFPFTVLGAQFGFVPPPRQFFLVLAGLVIGYLLLAEAVKIAFYRRSLAPEASAARV